ncbi:Protein kinase-like domain [Phytophthora cactorum]|nr:Protein kinase-like domain [Phytophthora cactorum]
MRPTSKEVHTPRTCSTWGENGLGTEVVVKCLVADNDKAQEEFRRESTVWYGLDHPNVVKMYGACHEGMPIFFVCEYVKGGNFVDLFEKDKTHHWRLFYSAALGLRYLHDKNIVHGDLKCNNILVEPTKDGKKAKICDFGFSYVRDRSQMSAKAKTQTIRWQAPEVLMPFDQEEHDHEYNPRFASDVYSFGMCIIEAFLNGETPNDNSCKVWTNAGHRRKTQRSRTCWQLSAVLRVLSVGNHGVSTPREDPVDLKERFQKLCYDVARIENGQHVTMHLGQFPRHSGLPLSTKAAAIGEGGRLASQMSSPRVLDSVITLTPAEEQILVDAMAEAFVPPEAPADLLAGIASAVAAFTSSNGRVPPQRTHPLFTKEQALEVLNGLLAAQQTDPQIVLETLAARLRLHPRALNVSAGVSFSNTTTESESSEPNLHLLAATGLTFGSMLPSPLAAEFGETTPRFLSSLGLLSPSPRPGQAKNGNNGANPNPLPPLTPSGLRKNNNG